MNQLPSISVLVPVFNVQDYLSECMDSVLSQTYRDFEVICIDDGSTDESGIMLDEYAERDVRVKVYHTLNGGYGKAMNYALSRATGEYICIVEPDDYILPNTLEFLYNKISNADADIVKANFKRFYGDVESRTYENVDICEDKSFYERVIIPRDEPVVLFHTMNTVTGIYSRNFLLTNNIKYNETPGASFQDNGFWFQTFIFARSVIYIDEYFYMNRRDNPNSSVKGSEKAFCVIDEFKFIEHVLEEHDELYNIFIEYFVKCKLIGYVAAYNRSSIKHKSSFVWAASDDLRRHWDAGQINKKLYGPKQWKKLLSLINSPEVFLAEDIQNKVLIQDSDLMLFDSLIQTKNDLIKLSKIKTQKIIRNNARISVIIPVFNSYDYIDDCIESVLNQTLKDVEVICVDDGSCDGSFNRLLFWAEKDSRVLVECQPNLGSGIARNRGLEMASGEFVFFLDSDDWLPSDDVLASLYDLAIKTGEKVVGGDLEAYRNNVALESPQHYTFECEGKILFSDYQMDYGYTRFLYSTKFLNDNLLRFPEYSRMQDPVFLVNVLIKAESFYAINKIVYAYRKSEKKKQFNATQYTDILRALYDLYKISSDNNYVLLKTRVFERISQEYFSGYMKYVVANESKVCDGFVKLFEVMDENHTKEMFSKLFFYISTELNIPLKKIRNHDLTNLPEYNNVLNQLNYSEKEWKQARYEVDSIRASFSYKLGLFLTYIPRKVRSAVRGKI